MSSRQRENDWKKRLGVVYSTSEDYDFAYQPSDQHKTLQVGDQLLSITLDKKQRRGKEVTLISGFLGKEYDLKNLGRLLKSKCGVGGSVKEGVVVIQGNQKDKLVKILSDLGYGIKNK